MKIKFQNWVILMTSLLVVTLAVAFLVTVFRTFTSISEDTAKERFALIAGQAEQKLEALIQENARVVRVRAGALQSNYLTNDALNPSTMVPTFLGSIAVDDNIYSQFFGLANDEFLQVIGVRGDARVLKALQAPEGTHFAVRRIIRAKDGSRTDNYLFLGRDRQALGSRSQEAGPGTIEAAQGSRIEENGGIKKGTCVPGSSPAWVTSLSS